MPNWCRFCYCLSLFYSHRMRVRMVLFTALRLRYFHTHTVCLSESTTFVFFKQNWKTLMQFCMEYHSLNAKSIVSMGAICMTLPSQIYVCVCGCLFVLFIFVCPFVFVSANIHVEQFVCLVNLYELECGAIRMIIR